MKFTINIAEFLDFKTGMPDLYEIDVLHNDGYVFELSIAPTALRHIKDINTLLDHIDAAAKNNAESSKLQP